MTRGPSNAVAIPHEHVPHEHVVQFYGRDEELTATVGVYLAEALRAGEAAVIVATTTHRASLEAELRRADIDVATARAEGVLVSLDARETMDRFLVTDRPDAERFHQVIGEVIRDAAKPGRPVRVYGEMVALLWNAGQVNAALELETLWNDLGREASFSLFCGYPAPPGSGEARREAFEEVCRLHSHVIGTPPVATTDEADTGTVEVARTFAAVPSTPRDARRFVVETLRRREATAVTDGATLVVNELVTNAVVHAGSELTVTVSSSEKTARISVQDAAPLHDHDQNPPYPIQPGHGLALVDAIADHWGVDRSGSGKVVWAEFRR